MRPRQDSADYYGCRTTTVQRLLRQLSPLLETIPDFDFSRDHKALGLEEEGPEAEFNIERTVAQLEIEFVKTYPATPNHPLRLRCSGHDV